MNQPTPPIELTGICLVEGHAHGPVLFSDVGLSFWGGVDPFTGEVIDRHHPLSGQRISGQVLVIPSGRGSCTGSSVLLESILNGNCPAAMVFERVEDILTLGVIIAEELFGRSLPVICLAPNDFQAVRHAACATVSGDRVSYVAPEASPQDRAPQSSAAINPLRSIVRLTPSDQAFLNGAHGQAAQAAMRIIQRMASILGAEELVDVSQGHIDGCVYTGPSSLAFAEKLCAWGAQVRIPTTMNSISVDKRRWQAQGVDPAFGEPAAALADAYLAMGVKPSFTCAPYLLDSAPAQGEQIVWAESNAVVFANSVLGARTMKYPDYLDIAIALTGRAPLAGCHIAANRLATIAIEVPHFDTVDDSFYPLLGYHVGGLAGSAIPVVLGLAGLAPGRDALKAFGAAFATTSSAPMFHMAGVTPEAATLAEATGPSGVVRTIRIERADLLQSWRELDGASGRTVDVIALGNPHFSETECLTLAQLCHGRPKHDDVAVIVTCSRSTHDRVAVDPAMQNLTAFGIQFVTDTCWCMVTEPVIPIAARTIMTNSGKYAHYGPGLVGRGFHFGSLAACVDAACAGQIDGRLPDWLG